MLFTYPGAFVQLIRNKFRHEYTARYSENITLTACRYFVDSCIVLPIIVYMYKFWVQADFNDIQGLCDSLSSLSNIFAYVANTFVISILYAFVRQKVVCLVHHSKHETGTSTTWTEINKMLFDQRANDLKYPVVKITRNGEMIAAGVLRYSYGEWELENAVLDYSDTVMQAFSDPELTEEYIEGSVVMFVNVAEGYEVTFYAAPKLYEVFSKAIS